MSANSKPLHLPQEYLPEPGPVESLCRWIPILGWIVSAFLESLRNGVVNKSIQNQLAARERVPPDVWGDDLKARTFARWYTQQIQDAFGRRADRLMPQDPMELVFFDDDFEYIEIIMEAREQWGFSKAWEEEVYTAMEQKEFLTLGEYIKYLVSTREFGEVDTPENILA